MPSPTLDMMSGFDVSQKEADFLNQKSINESSSRYGNGYLTCWTFSAITSEEMEKKHLIPA